MLTKEIAEEIVKETMNRLKRNINIIDPDGIIIASGDPSRVGLFHAGGLQVIKTGQPLVITAENEKNLPGSKTGINLPIEFQHAIVGAIGITGQKEDVEEFGDLVKMTTELMIKQASMASKQEWQQRLKEDTFTALLNPPINAEQIEQQLKQLAIQLHAPYHVFLIDLQQEKLADTTILKQIEQIIYPDRSLVGFHEGSKIFALTSGYTPQRLRKKLQAVKEMLTKANVRCQIGYGTPAEQLEAVAISFKEAELALRIRTGSKTFVSYEDIETEALIYQLDQLTKSRFLTRVFPQLTPKTKETLQTFFQYNMNITETAQALFVHRNTLMYRLKRIKEKTDYDPQLFADAVTLQIAIWIAAHLEEEKM
ncbi:helix-turn-helix domain-containing protein [Alkalihalobacillus oceani]|uniref:Helix-turn-helix domain-containing protein n=1 Tax=Halalkalibacter oceani TaxID=1653776 RepID=A0A9X2DSM3_9BACI|nr:helix-turn-helix domain-containing protein [Halalkalibacter oceani]